VTLIGTTYSDEKRVARIGGLRRGRMIAHIGRQLRARLDRYSYVPGVWVSSRAGRLTRDKLVLRVGGYAGAHGRVTFRLKRDLITGRLGGRRVHLRLGREISQAVGGLYELRRALRAPGAPGRLGRCCYSSQVLPPR
jgi:hypothetical protein